LRIKVILLAQKVGYNNNFHVLRKDQSSIILQYIKETFNVSIQFQDHKNGFIVMVFAMSSFQRNGFSYRQLKSAPHKDLQDKQYAFIEEYEA